MEQNQLAEKMEAERWQNNMLSQTPLSAFRERLRNIFSWLTTPHPHIKNVEELRKAELLSIITFTTSILLAFAMLAGIYNFEVLFVLTLITLSSYLFSRTTYHGLGAYLFTYAFTVMSFLGVYRGNAVSVIAASTTVELAIIFASVLLTQRGFFIQLVVAVGAIITAPMYSTLPTQETDSFVRTGGVVLAIGFVLYGINRYRARVAKEQLDKVNEANSKLGEMAASQEQRIEERTQELKEASAKLEQRALRLQAITDISQEVVANITQKPDEVLGRITQTISKKLGYYHVGIFLLDKEDEFAVLRAANSRGGQKMLTRRHQLKVGGTGIVGYVTQSGRPRIALDTSTDVVYFNNPDLPETRSEIALPLKYGEKIIGALDVQSSLSNAFSNEDVDTLSALANQVAVVIKNLQNTEDAKYLVPSVVEFTRKNLQSGYSFQPDGSIVANRLPDNNPALQRATASGETVILPATPQHSQSTLAVPVKFRERVVGVIHIESQDEKKKWTDDEIAFVQAISDRAALALENARLLEDSQKRAAKEQAIGEISTKISANTDIEAILRTAVRELGAQISGTQVTVEIGDGKR
jgi:GAF domain-containing protein